MVASTIDEHLLKGDNCDALLTLATTGLNGSLPPFAIRRRHSGSSNYAADRFDVGEGRG